MISRAIAYLNEQNVTNINPFQDWIDDIEMKLFSCSGHPNFSGLQGRLLALKKRTKEFSDGTQEKRRNREIEEGFSDFSSQVFTFVGGFSRRDRKKLFSSAEDIHSRASKVDTYEGLQNEISVLERDIMRLVKRIQNSKESNHVSSVPQGTTDIHRHFLPAKDSKSMKLLGKIQARVENIESKLHTSSENPFLDELAGIFERINTINVQEEDMNAHNLRIVLLQKVHALLSNPISGISSEEGSIMDDKHFGEIHPISESQKESGDVDEVLRIIQSFRKHVGVPSSTNHTSSGSVGDGSFWYRAISPMFDFLGQQIQKGEIDSTNFSWAQLADMHIENVEIRNQIDDISIFRIHLRQHSQNQNLIDNIHSLSDVLKSLRGTGRFRDENSFLTLINLIDTFG